MIKAFITYIKEEKLIHPSDTVLLAVSGGIDSVVMCELFHQAKIKFAIAHCNFQLRGKESDEDELFVEQLSEKYNVPFHTIAFDTKQYAKKNKISIQVAARELRYNWFNEIADNFNYDCIATAHHQDDSIETFFINLLRGTGIRGLHGILSNQNNIIRPLLFAGRKGIESFAKQNKLKFREDSSNEEDKYTRNKIRHHLIPLLREINNHSEKNILLAMEHLKQVEDIYSQSVQKKRSKVTINKGGITTISIAGLKKLEPLSAYLYEFLQPFGFNGAVVNEIIDSLDTSVSGKQFFSTTHRLIKDRSYLFIEEKKSKKNQSIEILKNSKTVIFDLSSLRLKSIKRTKDYSIIFKKSVAQLDYDKLVFPLTLRKWEKGDFFYPIGMKGKKKLSDFFIDQKLSLIEKEDVWVMLSENKVAWVVGYRVDDRFKITDKTRKIYFAELMK